MSNKTITNTLSCIEPEKLIRYLHYADERCLEMLAGDYTQEQRREIEAERQELNLIFGGLTSDEAIRKQRAQKAAPALYEALTEALEAVERLHEYLPSTRTFEILSKVRAALNQVEEK